MGSPLLNEAKKGLPGIGLGRGSQNVRRKVAPTVPDIPDKGEIAVSSATILEMSSRDRDSNAIILQQKLNLLLKLFDNVDTSGMSVEEQKIASNEVAEFSKIRGEVDGYVAQLGDSGGNTRMRVKQEKLDELDKKISESFISGVVISNGIELSNKRLDVIEGRVSALLEFYNSLDSSSREYEEDIELIKGAESVLPEMRGAIKSYLSKDASAGPAGMSLLFEKINDIDVGIPSLNISRNFARTGTPLSKDMGDRDKKMVAAEDRINERFSSVADYVRSLHEWASFQDLPEGMSDELDRAMSAGSNVKSALSRLSAGGSFDVKLDSFVKAEVELSKFADAAYNSEISKRFDSSTDHARLSNGFAIDAGTWADFRALKLDEGLAYNSASMISEGFSSLGNALSDAKFDVNEDGSPGFFTSESYKQVSGALRQLEFLSEDKTLPKSVRIKLHEYCKKANESLEVGSREGHIDKDAFSTASLSSALTINKIWEHYSGRYLTAGAAKDVGKMMCSSTIKAFKGLGKGGAFAVVAAALATWGVLRFSGRVLEALGMPGKAIAGGAAGLLGGTSPAKTGVQRLASAVGRGG